MSSIKKRVFFRDYTFLVDDNVYEPAEDSFLFAENLPTEKINNAIDIGTGCGILAIAASTTARRVFATDINPYAVHCAKLNAASNHVTSRMFFIQGDLFEPIAWRSRFDLILFNAPYLPSGDEDDSWLARAWAGGEHGRDVIDRFIDGSTRNLSSNGQILLMQSSLSNVEKTLARFNEKGFVADVVAAKNYPFFEQLVLIRAESSSTKTRLSPDSRC